MIYTKRIVTFEMIKHFPAIVQRTSGSLTDVFLQRVQRTNLEDDTAVVQWIENGKIIQKGVLMKDFVELNPKYKHLLRKPDVEVKFNTAQLKLLQECPYCPTQIGKL